MDNNKKLLLVGAVLVGGFLIWKNMSDNNGITDLSGNANFQNILSWSSGASNAAAWAAAAKTFTTTEMSNMSALINVWGKGGTPDAAQTSFFTALLAKYAL